MYFWYTRPKTGMVSIYRIVGLKHWTFSCHMCISHVESQGSQQGATCYWGLWLTGWSQLCLAEQPRCAIARQIDIYEDHSLWCYVSGTQVRMQLGWCSVMHCLVSDMAGCPGPVCLAAGRIPGPWSIGLLVTLGLLSTLLQALCTASSCNILSFWIRVKGNYLHFFYKYFSICDKCIFNVPRAFYNPIHWCLSLSLYSFKLSLRWLVLSSLCEFYKKNCPLFCTRWTP